MNSTLTVSIPMKPHLLAYLRWKQNLQPDEVLSLKHCQCDLAYILGNIITTKVAANFNQAKPLGKDYSEVLVFNINPRDFYDSHIIVDAAGARLFNSFLHKNMHSLLLDRVRQGKLHKVQAKETMVRFIDEIGATGLISFDAVDKASDRLRNHLKLAPFRSQTCRKGEEEGADAGAETVKANVHAA